MTSHGFGIVGTGIVAAMHADAIAALPGARLVAVTDADAGAAAAFAGRRGGTAERDLDLPDASIAAFEGITFLVILASESLYGRIPWLHGMFRGMPQGNK